MGITITNSGQGSVVRFRNLGRGGVMTTRVSPLLLDDYSGAAAAYSLRKLRGGYSGPVVRVRRSSDNAETNINFTSAGYIDTAALLSFCGAGNGFVTTWYDQSGNANNATQTTAGNQNKIVNAGSLYTLGTKPALYFDNGFYRMSNISLLNDFSYFVTTQKIGVVYGLQLGSITNNQIYFNQWSSGFFYISKPNGTTISRYSSVGGAYDYEILQGFSTSNDVKAFWNNDTLSLTLDNTVTDSNVFINQIGGLGPGPTGTSTQTYVQEIIIYSNSQLSNRGRINNNINAFYNIYTPSWSGNGTALLDLYPSAAAAYSLRNLSSTYLGPLVRVRRSSDNTEQDFYGSLNGELNTTAISTFCGAGNGFVTRWYDQSGNNNNASQTTAGFQPQIYFSGSFVYRSGKVYLQFSPTAELNMLNITRTAVQNYSFWSTYEKNATGNQPMYLGSGGYLWLDYGVNQYISNLSPINITPNNYAINTRYLVNHISDTSIVTIYSNNSIWGSRTNIDQAAINLISNAAKTATITMTEFIFYSNSQAANRTAITNNINSYYSIY